MYARFHTVKIKVAMGFYPYQRIWALVAIQSEPQIGHIFQKIIFTNFPKRMVSSIHIPKVWRAMSANIMCVVYVKILCAVCMQTCGVYASRCGVYASMCGVYASTCGVYESACGVYAYVWCVCQNHVWCVCQNHVRCVCQKFVIGVYVTYVIKFMCSVYVSACCVCLST